MKNKIFKYIGIFLISILIITGVSLITASKLSGSAKFISESEVTKYDLVASIPYKYKKTSKIASLQEQYQNPDIVGIVRIPQTSINEIVLQGNDNTYYLSHDINKNKTIAGSTYLDTRSNFQNGRKNIIYSHNSPTLPLPFHELENYYNEEFYQSHQYIELEDDYGLNKYQIFSVYVEATDWSYYQKFTFATEQEWLSHLQQLKNKSWYQTNVDVNATDEILILQTCSFHENFQQYQNKYLLVIAKKI